MRQRNTAVFLFFPAVLLALSSASTLKGEGGQRFGEPGTLLTKKVLEDLPLNGRDVFSLVALHPGVSGPGNDLQVLSGSNLTNQTMLIQGANIFSLGGGQRFGDHNVVSLIQDLKPVILGVGDDQQVLYQQILSGNQDYYSVNIDVKDVQLALLAYNARTYQPEIFWGSNPQNLNHLPLETGQDLIAAIFGGAEPQIFLRENNNATCIGQNNIGEFVALDVNLPTGQLTTQVLDVVRTPPALELQYGSESFGMDLGRYLLYTYFDRGLVYQIVYDPETKTSVHDLIGTHSGSGLTQIGGAQINPHSAAITWPGNIAGVEVWTDDSGPDSAFGSSTFGGIEHPFDGATGFIGVGNLPTHLVGNLNNQFSIADVNLFNTITLPQAPTSITEGQITNLEDFDLNVGFQLWDSSGTVLENAQYEIPPGETIEIEPGKGLPLASAHGLFSAPGNFLVGGTWDIGGFSVAIAPESWARGWYFPVKQKGDLRAGFALSNSGDLTANCTASLWGQSGTQIDTTDITLDPRTSDVRFADEIWSGVDDGLIGYAGVWCDYGIAATGVSQNQTDQSLVISPGKSTDVDSLYSGSRGRAFLKFRW